MGFRTGDQKVITEGKNSNAKTIFWVFFGIIAFICVMYPFYGMNLRYRFGATLTKAYGSVGTITVSAGMLMLVWGIIMIFLKRTAGGMKIAILGMLLMYIGSMFLAPGTAGTIGTGQEVPKGYH